VRVAVRSFERGAAVLDQVPHDDVTRGLADTEQDRHHPLLLVGLAVLDLLVIHPFEEGNGRLARIVTNALLSQAGYGLTRYVTSSIRRHGGSRSPTSAQRCRGG